MNFTLKVINNNRIVQRVQAHSLRRFTNHLRTINWQNRPLKVYLRVSYGEHEDCFGKVGNFYNDGWYGNEKDLWQAFNAFKDEGKEWK